MSDEYQWLHHYFEILILNYVTLIHLTCQQKISKNKIIYSTNTIYEKNLKPVIP